MIEIYSLANSSTINGTGEMASRLVREPHGRQFENITMSLY